MESPSGQGASGAEWLVDSALKEVAQDGLGREPFITRATELFNELAVTSDSTVIGIVGPWGSGKTSSVNMIVRSLNRETWQVNYLTPWAVSGPDAIIAELLTAISAAIPASGYKGKKARAALKKYGTLLTPLLLAVPHGGSVAKGVSDVLLQRLSGEGTVHEQTESLGKALAELGQPILLIVDDVDRLQPDELLALFKAVRVLGRLPNVHYLLAYDQQTLLDVLSNTTLAKGDMPRALAFLEKIVTLPLEQPPTRPEQAQGLFEQGLAEVLSLTGHSALTEDQQERLAEERERLLKGALTEPRTIRRFLSQLRIYLPLVGASEIDIVDFLVISLLRTTYPTLYRFLAAERTLLVRRSLPEDGESRVAVTSETALNRVNVPLRDHARVRAALIRLFPLLDPNQDAGLVYEEERRRRDRRVSDPDTVGRYFALGPISGDLSDAILLAVLEEWASTGRVESDSGIAVRQLLSPDPSKPTQCDRAAVIVRRATARSGELSASQAAHLLEVVTGLLPDQIGTGGAGVGFEYAMVAWLAALLSLAEGPDPAALLQTLARPSGEPSSLPHFLRAMRLARESAQGGRRMEAAQSTSWYTRMADAAASLVWDRFLGNVRAGDAAPAEPAGFYLRWLDGVLGEAEVDRRLDAAVADGLSVTDLAARFVETGTDLSGHHETIMGFDAYSFLRRIGLDNVRSAVAVQQATDSDTAQAKLEEEDLGWRNRRGIATDHIVRALQTDPEGARQLPVLRTVPRSPALLNHRPDLLGNPGQRPDLSLRLAVQVSTEPLPPVSIAKPTPEAAWQQVESEVLKLLSKGPMARWLRSAGASWHAQPGDWKIKDVEPARRLELHLETTRTDGEEAPGKQSTLHLGLQAVLPDDNRIDELSSAPVVFTLGAAIWMADLGADRRPTTTSSTSEPMPAAMTLKEVSRALAALISSTSDALRVLSVARPRMRCSTAVLADLVLEVGSGLGSVVDLRQMSRVGMSGKTSFSAAVPLELRSLGGGAYAFSPSPEDVAIGLLSKWLFADGYREYEGVLVELLNMGG